VIDSERACPALILSWQGDFGPFSFAAQMSAGTPSTTDDGSRVSAHFWHPSLKTSTSAHFEAALAIDNNLDKKGKDSLLLGTVNDYAPASNPAELDHETGQLLMLSPTVSANLHYVTLRHWH